MAAYVVEDGLSCSVAEPDLNGLCDFIDTPGAADRVRQRPEICDIEGLEEMVPLVLRNFLFDCLVRKPVAILGKCPFTVPHIAFCDPQLKNTVPNTHSRAARFLDSDNPQAAVMRA